MNSVIRRQENLGIEMLEYINEEGVEKGINPFDHGAVLYGYHENAGIKAGIEQIWIHGSFWWRQKR